MDDDIAAVGDAHRLVEILLGHQHGQLVALLQLLDLLDRALDQDRRETRPRARRSAGSSAPTSRRGPRPASAARRPTCCRRAGGAARATPGRSRSSLRGCAAISARALGRKAPSSRFSSTVSLGKSRRPSGTRLIPRSTIASVERPTRSCRAPSISADDRPGHRPHDAHHAFHDRALAVAVGAEQHHGLARPDLDRHVVDHPHRAIAGIDAGDRKAIRQDRPSRPRGCASPPAAGRRRSCGRRRARRAGSRSSSPRA